MNLLSRIKKRRRERETSSYSNAVWLEEKMSPYFFKGMADEPEALELLAREMPTLAVNRRLILADREKLLIIACPNLAGSLYDTLKTVGEREMSYGMFSHSNGNLPGQSVELEVQRFEFNRKSDADISLDRISEIPPRIISDTRKKLRNNFPEFDLAKMEKVLSILWCNNQNYILLSPPSRIAWLCWLFDQGNRSGGLFADVTDIEHQGECESRVLIAIGNQPQHGFMLQLLEIFNRLDIGIRRGYCYNISNGLHPYFLGAFFVKSRTGAATSPGSVLASTLIREIGATQLISPASQCYEAVVARSVMTGEEAALVEAFIAFTHTTLAHNLPERFGRDGVATAFMDHPEMSRLLIDLFNARFNPDLERREQIYERLLGEVTESISSYSTGHKWLDSIRRSIYATALLLVTHTLKTNYFIPLKQALSFRLDPLYLHQLDKGAVSDLPEALPFRITFFFCRSGYGYHVGFSDIARGGWRTVMAKNSDDLTTAANNLFREVFVLAHTQHFKNKDIYEGGSKMVLLLDLSEEEPGEEQARNLLYKLQYSVANAFLDIFVTEQGKAKNQRVVDYYGDDEPIELGPDENMHDGMIEAIAALSRKRGYLLGSGIMSSKKIGINHKEYGVTSTGVVTTAAITLKELLGIDMAADNFSLVMTGGPNGDVAGNTIRILLQESPGFRLKGILDGTAAVYDPAGINHSALEKLVLKHDLDKFDPSLLGAGGFIIYRSGVKRDGVAEFHRKISSDSDCIREEWLEVDEFYHQFNAFIFRIESDLFIPAGGRPETIDEENCGELKSSAGGPLFKVIVEGANSFITPAARLAIQSSGTVIIRDASANKCGVISSSYEIIANLLMSDREFTEEKEQFVNEVLTILKRRAAEETGRIMALYKEGGGKIPCTRISDQLSMEINSLYAKLFGFFEAKPELRLKRPFIDALYRHLPPIITENRRYRRRISSLPPKYISAMLAAEIATSMVYGCGAVGDFEEQVRRHLARITER